MSDTTEPKSVCLTVLGMHRSGTSALTRALSLCGVGLPDRLMGPVEGSNETGHWEPDYLVAENEALLKKLDSRWDDWRALNFQNISKSAKDVLMAPLLECVRRDFNELPLIALKDPRICRMVPFYQEVLDLAGYEMQAIIPLRNPLNVCLSLEKRDNFDFTKSSLLWLRHFLDAEYATRKMKRTFCRHDEFITSPTETLKKIGTNLGLKWPYNLRDVEDQIQSFVDDALVHQNASSEELEFHPELKQWSAKAYFNALVLEKNPRSKSALKALDEIRTEFDASADFIHLFLSTRTRHLENAAQQLRQELQTEISQISEQRTLTHSQLDQVSTERDKALEEVDELARQHETLAHESTLLRQQADALSAELALAKSENDSMSRDIAEAQGRVEKLSQELATAQDEVEATSRAISETLREKENITAELVMSERERETISVRAEQTASFLASRQAEFDDAVQRKDGLLFELQAAHDRAHAQGEIIAAMRNSRSWRLSSPFRVAGNIGRLFNRRSRAMVKAIIFRPTKVVEDPAEVTGPAMESSSPPELICQMDYVVSRNDLIFGWGWMFSPRGPIKQAFLEARNDRGDTRRIAVSYGVAREDVLLSYPDYAHARNTGFSIVGAWHLNGYSEIAAVGILEDGTRVSTSIRETDLQGASKPQIGDLLSTNKIRKGLDLVRTGQWREIKQRVENYGWNTNVSPANADQLDDVFSDIQSSPGDTAMLYIDHSLGGGANSYSRSKLADLLKEQKTVAVLTFDLRSLSYCIDVYKGTEKPRKARAVSAVDIFRFFGQLSNLDVYVNNIVSFPDPEALIAMICELKQRSGGSLTVASHDHYACCPSHFLLNRDGVYCDVPDVDVCAKCLPENAHGFTSLAKSQNIVVWRESWQRLLEAADEVLYFSNATKNTFHRVFPNLSEESAAVVPHKHEVEFSGEVEIDYSQPLCVGILGSISYPKGAEIVKELAEEIRVRGLHTKIKIIGQIDCDVPSDIVEVSGTYEVEQLPQLINKSGANLFLFPSIVPETFSFVIDELQQLNVPVLSFDLGAAGERVSQYPLGRVISTGSADHVLDALESFWAQLQSDQKLAKVQ